MGARYLLMIGAHFAELSEINHPADRELNGNDLDRIPCNAIKSMLQHNPIINQSLKLTVVMMVVAGFNSL
jgi:hypothetical protein